MTAIVEWVMAANPTIHKAASNYIDDIFVREDLVSVVHVRNHFRAWGLVTKEPEYLGNAAVRVLGLSVDSQFRWSRDKQLPDINGEPLDTPASASGSGRMGWPLPSCKLAACRKCLPAALHSF